MKKPVVIIGGGLWGGLLAYALYKQDPSLEFQLYEEKESLGGNHTWSFHETDIAEEHFEFLKPFITMSWNEYEVYFPKYRRVIKSGYHSITSDRFHEVLIKTLPAERVFVNSKISLSEIQQQSDVIFDARGSRHYGECGYQKFLGLVIETENDHGVTRPVLMDNLVDQIDGFRFLYTLPLSQTTLLIEDTRYSDNSFLDFFRIRENIKDYCRQKGWKIKNIIREESGALPIPYNLTSEASDESCIDLRGIFHDTTGYSLPDAMRLISLLTNGPMDKETLQRKVSSYRSSRTSDRKFFCFLNRLMFHASEDQDRYRMLEFFYKSSPSIMNKFYKGQLSSLDKVRFFIGIPPVSLSKSMNVIIESFNLQKETQS